MYKIILLTKLPDNQISETLVESNIYSEDYANTLCEELNHTASLIQEYKVINVTDK